MEPELGLALGHRRLAVLDTTNRGHQPMMSSDGRYVIVYNGEIYNFAAIRRDLEGLGRRFLGTSDTEVLVEAIACWGMAAAIDRCNGMFAVGVWDRAERELSLARDRLGEKPLYYTVQGRRCAFASELKALRAWPDLVLPVDRGALASYLRHGYVPAPLSIYTGVKKLQPGTIVTLSLQGAGIVDLGSTAYWDFRSVVMASRSRPFSDLNEAIETLENALTEAVRLRLVSDVPIGAFLSGGIDSSTVVAIMQELVSSSVKTFTVGFHEASHDEAGHAREIARHLGTEHTELYVSPEEARAVIPLLPSLYDEPLADSSQIPTYLVSQLARQTVTVALSGDGGDELFGGYERYARARRAWGLVRPIPRFVRRAVRSGVMRVPVELWDRHPRVLSQAASLAGLDGMSGHRVQRAAELIGSESLRQVYESMMSLWDAGALMADTEPAVGILAPENWLGDGRFTEPMQFMDTKSYLPDDILVKLDRASMGVGLEARVPLLDPSVVEAAWRVAQDQLEMVGLSKWPLRRILASRVPPELFERPKMGFGVPIGEWLRGPLKNWAGELLGGPRLKEAGYFQEDRVRALWEDHLSGRRQWEYHLWVILMFEAWREEYGD